MIEQIKNWFQLAVPEPTDKNRAVQIGVHFEEVCEMAAVCSEIELATALCNKAKFYKQVENYVLPPVDRKELLDALCDQIVTAVGVAHMFGMDIEGALAEVNRSNYSKFLADGTPLFDANGKITKNPLTYTKPDLTPFVG